MAAVAVGALGMVTFPAISSLKSRGVSAAEQGQVQGALYGALPGAGRPLRCVASAFLEGVQSQEEGARKALRPVTLVEGRGLPGSLQVLAGC